MTASDPAALIDDEAITEGASVLLAAPTFGQRADEGCVELLRLFPAASNVLFVTLVQSPDGRLEAWRRYVGDEPSSVGFVVVGDGHRSAGTTSGRSGETRMPVETVSNAGDLTGIGIAIHKFLDRWADDAPTALCFHSLTPLLQHVDLRDAFQFLHLLTNQLRNSGAIAHFHVDPDAHDRQTLHTLYAVFDVVVGWEPDPESREEADGGSWYVNRR